jgi:arginyl-tRNA synthetase
LSAAPPPTLSAWLTGLVAAATDAAGYAGVIDGIEAALPTANPAHGDYQSNHAFRVAKARKLNPRQVAEAVRAALPAHPGLRKVEVAGPGFLNFSLTEEWLAERLAAQVEDAQLGVPQRGAGQTVVIDYSSPNVAKRMHVGHMRSTQIGHALLGLHEAAGWKVVADNHIGDWGTQYGKLFVAWDRWRDEAAYAEDAIGELERLYVRFGEELKALPEGGEEARALEDLARAETAKLQAGDPGRLALWKEFVEVSLREFNGVYARMGVRFDVVLGESYYNEALPGVVAEYLSAGIAERSEGAVVIRFDGEGLSGALKGTTLVIQKKDGAFLYGTTDLATLQHRVHSWDPGRVVVVTDKRQQLHFAQFYHAWRQLHPGSRPELVHAWFGTLNLPSGLAISTRGGASGLRLVDLLDEAVRRAKAVVDQKSPNYDEAERAVIAEAVGVGAVRYADLCQHPQTDVLFDFDRMLSLEGNTAPFLMYAYARARSIQRKGGVEPSLHGLALGHPLERALGLTLLRYPDQLCAALDSYRPNLLCDALYEVAGAFNRFYFELPVLDAGTPAEREARLALVEASARVLAHGMRVLGLRVLDRM